MICIVLLFLIDLYLDLNDNSKMPQVDSFILLNSVLSGSVFTGFLYLISYSGNFSKAFFKHYLVSKITESSLLKFSLFSKTKGFLKLNNFFYY
jgi:hypothetical protein